MKKYILEATVNEDGKLSIRSHNDGFSVLELLGIFSFKHEDVARQMKGEIKPDIIKRECVGKNE